MEETFIRGQRVIPPRERIESFVAPCPLTGCWLWTGTRRGNLRLKSYGRLPIGSRTDGTRKFVDAHRYSYEVFIGPIPEGLWVLHKCDTPACVNPDHLYVGDRMANVRDRDSKGRNRPLSGSKNSNAKLTEDQVADIRRSFRPREVTREMLAKRFGVSVGTIKDILHGRSWAPPEE